MFVKPGPIHNHSQLDTVCQSCPVASLVAQQSFCSLLDEARAPPVHDVLHFHPNRHTLGQKGAGGTGGSDIKDPPRCQMGPQLTSTPPHILSYKCHKDKFGVGELLAPFLPGGYLSG